MPYLHDGHLLPQPPQNLRGRLEARRPRLKASVRTHSGLQLLYKVFQLALVLAVEEPEPKVQPSHVKLGRAIQSRGPDFAKRDVLNVTSSFFRFSSLCYLVRECYSSLCYLVRE